MCTYTFEQVACSCAKGADCPQRTSGQVRVNGELFHLLDMYQAVDELGAACDFQRTMFGRHAQPTTLCPRYGTDSRRIIRGSYKLSALACIKCAQSCAPPHSVWHVTSEQQQPQQQQQAETTDVAVQAKQG